MSAMGEEYRADILRHTVLYLYPDYSVFRQGYMVSSAATDNGGQQVYELDFSVPAPAREAGTSYSVPDISEDATLQVPQIEESRDEEVHPSESLHRNIYVVGGDYFMPEELKNVQGQDLSSLKTDHVKMSADDGSTFTDESYYTETLARIYADQELYDRANEVYEKLILLYPEKSAYFAALKNDIKKHL